ncbi:hypothetical protein ACFFGH_06275 [Lysobacter korlensis]|uniref:Lipoprotein n=1 Tax=Lysobacter korlensis TaxID=553636 RepID=A0ABV6RM44_9GAMM
MLAGCALAGCTSAGPAGQTDQANASAGATTAETVTLAPGNAAPLPAGAQLRFVSVESDSRCPPQVQCIHAGEAVLLFELKPGNGKPEPLRLTTTPPADRVSVRGWQLTLLELDRSSPPKATLRLARRAE